MEGVGVALLSLLLSGAPEGVGAADQVTAVQVVVRVELIAGLGVFLFMSLPLLIVGGVLFASG